MKKVLAVSLVMILAMASTAASAATASYTEYRGADGGSWNVASNWTAGVPQVLDTPGSLSQAPTFSKAGFKGWGSNGGKSTGIYAGTIASVDQIVVGGGNLTDGGTNAATAGGYLNVDGGTVNVSEFIHVGNAGTDTGTITINSGTLNCGVNVSSYGFLKVGYLGTGTLNMNGGMLHLTTFLAIADGTAATSTGTVNLNAGVIYATDLFMKRNNIGTASMVIEDGFLVLNNATDLTSKLNGYIASGLIKCAPGYIVRAEYDSESQTTTVWKDVPEPATICLLGLGAAVLRKRKR